MIARNLARGEFQEDTGLADTLWGCIVGLFISHKCALVCWNGEVEHGHDTQTFESQ